MYFKRVTLNNYGPIENAGIEAEFDGELPIPLLILGVNGSGKSLLLSILLDAMVSMRSTVFSNAQEIEQGKLFKPISQRIRMFGENKIARARCTFAHENSEIIFDEIVSVQGADGKFIQPQDPPPLPTFTKDMFDQSGLSKSISQNKSDYENSVRSDVLAYYPAGRAERPSWLSEDANIEFDLSTKFLNAAKYGMWRTNVISEVSNWILDVVLDSELYDIAHQNIDIGGRQVTVRVPIPGGNRNIIHHLNSILTLVISASKPEFEQVRLAVNRKVSGNRTVAIAARRADGSEVNVAQSILDLSTGELMLFSLFSDIVRIADLQGWNKQNLHDIKGVVLIDEADIHLHIKLQKEVLPKLIQMFPAVQFVMTTHSIFLPLGVESESMQLVNLPDGAPIKPSEFSEFAEAYDTFIEQNRTFQTEIESLNKQLKENDKLLVVTEGKTDSGHLKNALKKYQSEGMFADLDVEFHEASSDMGDGELEKVFHIHAKIPPRRPVLCLFDRDNKKVVQKYARSDGGFVIERATAAACIAVPAHRDEEFGICIEHLYLDKDLHTKLPGTEKRIRFKHEIAFDHTKKNAFLLRKPSDDKSLEIFDKDVGALSYQDGTAKGELAISKSAFLDQIVLTDAGKDFDLSGFLPTLELIQTVETELKKQNS